MSPRRARDARLLKTMVPPFTRWVFCLSALVACNPSGGDGGNTSGPSDIGPEGGLIDFDASAIPAPWDDATPHPPEGDGGIPPGDSGRIVDGGGEAHAPTCTGTPTPCSLVAACGSVQGCSLQGSCSGLSESCFGQLGDIECISLRGCVWDTSTNSCTGSSWPCNLFNGSATCVSQLGCSWDSACAGTPTPCSLIPAAACLTQPGCFLE
jgi:hypothetical protein